MVVPITVMKREALGRALQSHVDQVQMIGFDVRIIFVDPFKALAGLLGSILGVEIQPTGAGDHLPKLDIRIRRLKEMARAVLNRLDYKLPIGFVNQLVTFCVSHINVQTTSSLTCNMCPRVRMAGRKVDYKKEYALTFGEYTEVNPRVVSNSMAPRTDPCIALYPTLNVNGSWKFYNLRTQMVVARSQYTKIKHTPDNIVSAMNFLAVSKETLKPDDKDVSPNILDDMQGQNFEPGLFVHIPDLNVVEIINDNTGGIDDDTLVEDDEAEIVQEPPDVLEDDVLEPTVEEEVEVVAPPSTRRSARSTAGLASMYEGYSMMTRGYAMASANLKVKVALERFGKIAYDAIKDELTQLFIKKRALVPKLLKEICRANLYLHTVRSHMFLREKLDAAEIL